MHFAPTRGVSSWNYEGLSNSPTMTMGKDRDLMWGESMMTDLESGLKWDERRSVGFEPIDVQHRLILELLIEASMYIQSGTLTPQYVMGFMDRYLVQVESHIIYEEALIELAGNEFPKEHREHHRDMLLRLKGIALSLDHNCIEQFQMTTQMLQTWMIRHLENDDRDYRPLLGALKLRPRMTLATSQTVHPALDRFMDLVPR